MEGRWRVRGVKLEQVGKSAGMQENTVGAGLQVCEVKEVSELRPSMCGCALLHGTKSHGYKSFNPVTIRCSAFRFSKNASVCLLMWSVRVFITGFNKSKCRD